MKKFVSEELHSSGRKWVPILDPGIKIEPGYAPYESGKEATERPGASPDERVFIVVAGGGDEGGEGRRRRGGSSDSNSSSTPSLPLVVPFAGTVWPGRVHYPDFLSPAARGFWSREIEALHSLVPFDGLWIDMAEPSNFDDDGDHEGDESRRGKGGRGGGGGGGEGGGGGGEKAENPLYPINNGGRRDPLSTKTVSAWARGASGQRRGANSSSSSALHIDTHNLYGLSEASATREALVRVLASERAKKKAAETELLLSSPSTSSSSSASSPPPPPLSPPSTPRPFILARSSFLGLGSFATHWTGDNAATWQDLSWSAWGIFNSGLFAGATLSGADVCGFSLDTTEKLCSRWVAAAAFQPFWRSHSDKSAAPQEPYLWQSVADAARPALGARYRLLPMLYSGLARSAVAGAPLMRPLWYEWPEERNAHENDLSWVLAGGGRGKGGVRFGGDDNAGDDGKGSTSSLAAPLFVAPPLLESDSDSVLTWLPPGKWFDLWGLMEDALGLELEIFEKGRRSTGGKCREKSPQSSPEKMAIASFDGGEHGVAFFSLPAPPGRAVALLQRQGSIIPLAWSSSSSSPSSVSGGEDDKEEGSDKDNPLLSIAAALGAPLALSAALECSFPSNCSSSCSAFGSLFADDGETDSPGDWWLLRASIDERGGRVEAELSNGVSSSPFSSPPSAPPLPRHPPPRLRRVSISGTEEDTARMFFSILGSVGLATTKTTTTGVRSELGEAVVVAATSTSTTTTTAAGTSSTSASVITFEFPETPSFVSVAADRRESTESGSSSSAITLVSWGDGGGGGGRGGVAVA